MPPRPIPRRSLLALITAGATWPALVGAASRSDDDDDEGGIPNLFISPCGEPFRAAYGAPYPKVDWFKGANKAGDGKLTHAEFIADAERFFKRLDINGDGVLSHFEILVYEHKLVPEILGGTLSVGMLGVPHVWLAQYGGRDAPPIDPSGQDRLDTAHPAPKGFSEGAVGAAPYSFFEEPEPILTADFNVTGVILKDNYLRVADTHFQDLDGDGRGYLTLDGLPMTLVEKMLLKAHKIARRR